MAENKEKNTPADKMEDADKATEEMACQHTDPIIENKDCPVCSEVVAFSKLHISTTTAATEDATTTTSMAATPESLKAMEKELERQRKLFLENQVKIDKMRKNLVKAETRVEKMTKRKKPREIETTQDVVDRVRKLQDHGIINKELIDYWKNLGYWPDHNCLDELERIEAEHGASMAEIRIDKKRYQAQLKELLDSKTARDAPLPFGNVSEQISKVVTDCLASITLWSKDKKPRDVDKQDADTPFSRERRLSLELEIEAAFLSKLALYKKHDQGTLRMIVGWSEKFDGIKDNESLLQRIKVAGYVTNLLIRYVVATTVHSAMIRFHTQEERDTIVRNVQQLHSEAITALNGISAAVLNLPYDWVARHSDVQYAQQELAVIEKAQSME